MTAPAADLWETRLVDADGYRDIRQHRRRCETCGAWTDWQILSMAALDHARHMARVHGLPTRPSDAL